MKNLLQLLAIVILSTSCNKSIEDIYIENGGIYDLYIYTSDKVQDDDLKVHMGDFFLSSEGDMHYEDKMGIWTTSEGVINLIFHDHEELFTKMKRETYVWDDKQGCFILQSSDGLKKCLILNEELSVKYLNKRI